MEAKVHRINMGREDAAVFDLEGNLGAEVIPQILADAGALAHDGNVQLLQLVLGANARQHEQLRRADRPGAQHHPVGGNREHLAAAFGFHADGSGPLKQDLPDVHPAPHRQVQPVAHRHEIRQRCAHAHAIDIVRRRHPQAGGVLAIGILRDAKARLPTGGMEGLLKSRPGPGLPATDGHGTVRTMEIILDIEVVLRFAKVRQDLVIRPLTVAERGPGVKILWETRL